MADYEDLSRRLRYLSDFVRESTTILTAVYEYVSVCTDPKIWINTIRFLVIKLILIILHRIYKAPYG